MSEGRPCKIVLLNGQRLDIIVQSKLKTSDLVEITLSHFFVKEQQCFGLYTIESNYVYWLDQKKNVLDHEFIRRDGPITIYLGVKFYLASTSMLKDLKAIELFYLQARSHISQGVLVCDASVLCSLAALALQFEYKDYEDDSHFASALVRSQLLPSKPSKDSSSDLDSQIKQKYKELIGMSRGEALVKYLRMVESLPTYGVHFYAVKDKKGASNWLGISLRGIVVMEIDPRKSSSSSQSKRHTYNWPELENIFHNDRKFHFEERRSYASNRRSQQQVFSTTEVNLYSFLADNPSAAKCIWSACVDQHHFYLETTKMKPVRIEVESLARELDDSLSARKQGYQIETFLTERFKQMAEVVQELKTKRSLLDSLMKDKMNLIKKLEEEESAITKMPPQDVQPIPDDFEQKWGNSTISYGHYEANKTLSTLDEIFRVEQKITVGCYKLVVLHNNTTAKLMHRMVTLQLTPVGEFKSLHPNIRKKWVDMYKSSLAKLKEIERKVNRYRKVLNMSCVDFASRFEDHKITQRPISSVQKQMVCRCANHSHKVLQQQEHRHHHSKQDHHHHSQQDHHHHSKQDQHHHQEPQHDGDTSTRRTEDSVNRSIQAPANNNSTHNDLPPISMLPPLPGQKNKKALPSPSVVSTTGSMSSSSSSQQYLMCNTDSSNSSSALSSPYLQDPRQHPTGSLPRPPRVDQGVFAYPERGGHLPVARNHSCDELGDRNVVKVAEEYPNTTDSLKMRSCRGVVDGYDSRSIRGLSKRYSYKMALESHDADDVHDDDHHYDFVEDDDDEEDNLYSVSNTRTAHILTRSSSTHHTAHHCQHHVQQSSVDPHVRHRHHQHGLSQNKDHIRQQHHHYHQYDQQTQQQLHHHHHHHHQQHPPNTANSAPQASAAPKDFSRHHHQGHSRKPSDSTPRAPTSKPPLHKSEKQCMSQRKAELQEPRFNYLPVDKSPSVTSTSSSHIKSSKSSSGAFLRTCAGFENMKISNDFASCFKGQRKNSELLDEIGGPSTPGSSDRMKTFCTPPQRNLVRHDAFTIPNDHSEDRLALMAATSADVSFMQSIESFEVDNDSLSNGLFLDNSDWAYGSCLQDLVHDRSFVRDLCMSQQLRMEDFQKCMDHLNQKRTRLKLLTPLHMTESHDPRRDGNLPSSRHHHQSLEPRVHRPCNHPCQVHHPASVSNQIHHNQSSASRNVNQLPVPNSSQSQRGHEHSGRPRTASCSVLGKDM